MTAGESWYDLYKITQSRAIDLFADSEDPVEVANRFLIELADWRWLKRTHLKKPNDVNIDERKKWVGLWMKALDAAELRSKDLLVLSEAIIWTVASIATFRKKPPKPKEREAAKRAAKKMATKTTEPWLLLIILM